jgi:hypothetical protein
MAVAKQSKPVKSHQTETPLKCTEMTSGGFASLRYEMPRKRMEWHRSGIASTARHSHEQAKNGYALKRHGERAGKAKAKRGYPLICMRSKRKASKRRESTSLHRLDLEKSVAASALDSAAKRSAETEKHRVTVRGQRKSASEAPTSEARMGTG